MAKMSKTQEVQIARRFFDAAFDFVDNELDDEVYENIYADLDPEGKTNIPELFNLWTIKEIIELGFRAKYGVPWKEGNNGNKE